MTMEKYMSDFKEQTDISEQDDFILNEMDTTDIPKYNYDNKMSISSSKQEFGLPTLSMLGSLLCAECSEIEKLRNKTNIGYYAHFGSNAVGYRNIDDEDVTNLESIILSNVPSETKMVDFILSSPGGYIDSSLKLTNMIRQRFDQLSFLLPGATYSAATAMTFSGDEIIMQSNSHLAPINPRINGFDTYLGKKIYNKVHLYSICCPWALKNLPDAKITENNVTMRTMESLEALVYKQATNRLSKHLFKVDKMSFFQKLKTKKKIKAIVDFFVKYERHHTHIMPFFIDELMSIGFPIKKADDDLDKHLRIIRNLCEEITTTEWHNDNEVFFVRKIYFSTEHWYVLKHYPSLPPEQN